MWTTSDGHALTLPRSRLAPIILQMRKPEMKDLVKRNYQGDLRQAVVRSVGQLASNAHRTGNLRHRRSNRRYPVFTAGLNGREYEIITSPVGSTQNAIISVGAEPSFELQEVTAPLGWKKYPSDSNGIFVPPDAEFRRAGWVGKPNDKVTPKFGVYIIEIPRIIIDPPRNCAWIRSPDLGNKRFYVGSATASSRESESGGLLSRIQGHRQTLNHYGINPKLYPIHVWETPKARTAETEIQQVNGAPKGGSQRRQPWTILTNEIEIEELWENYWENPLLEGEIDEALRQIEIAKRTGERIPRPPDIETILMAIEAALNALKRISKQTVETKQIQQNLEKAKYSLNLGLKTSTTTDVFRTFINNAHTLAQIAALAQGKRI